VTAIALLPKFRKNEDSKVVSTPTDKEVTESFFGATP